MLLKVTGDGKGINAQEVRRSLALLADSRYAIQLQVAPSWRWRTFDATPTGLDEAVVWCRENASATGMYYALNPIARGLNHRVLVGDAIYRRWLLVDIDRNKLPGDKDLSATDEEHEAARSLMMDVMEYLDGRKWPAPLIVDSGNGFHLLYRMDLPNNEVSREGCKTILAKLAKKFNGSRGEVDTACFDARRISKLPGTWARKGTPTKERPHRMARLIGGPG